MSLSRGRTKFENLLKDLDRTRVKEFEKIALDALALLKSRVINTGKDADGKKFSGYSEAVVPYWYHGSQDGVSSRDTEKLLSSKGYFASYKDLREVKGLPTNIKNFSFTNKMWNGLGVKAISSNNGIVVFGITTVSERDDILAIHHGKDEILDLAGDEIALVSKLSRDRLLNAFKRNGL